MWRRTAPFHVQLALETPGQIHRLRNGDVKIEGRAIRVFRTDGRVALGDPLWFGIYGCDPGDEPTGPAYIHFEDLASARYIEAYLCGTPPACELAAYEFRIIPAPSEEPTMTPGELEALLQSLNNGQPRGPHST